MRSDLHQRTDLFANIILAGDDATSPALIEPLDSALRDAMKITTTDVNFIRPASPEQAVWMGGDKLAPWINEQNGWLLKADYQQQGAAGIHRKCI